MKQRYYLLFLLPIQSLMACPTCVGRLNADTPTPFFSNEHYKPHAQAPTTAQINVEAELSEDTPQEEPINITEDLLP